MILKRWWLGLLELLLPRVCCGCGERLATGERLVCARCQLTLPLETNRDWDFNRRKRAWGDHPALAHVGALTRYERTNVSAELVRSLKFHRRYELGAWMGRVAVLSLRDTGLFEGVEVLIPIPLTRRRLHTRGFNQAEKIADGLAGELHIPVRTDVLRRLRYQESQTHFMLTKRRDNVQGIFELLTDEGLRGKHVMIVDDVITTGATMLAAIEALERVPDIRISVFAWAWAPVPAGSQT